MKKVVMGFELLAHMVTLPLHRLGVAVVYPDHLRHFGFDAGDVRVPAVEVTAG